MKIEAMLWIVVLILVALAFLFPKTRSFSLSAIGLAIVAIVLIVVIAKRPEPLAPPVAAPPAVEQKPVDFERFHVEKLDRADPEAKTRIRVEEIRFDQIRAVAGVRTWQCWYDRGATLQRLSDLYVDRLWLLSRGARLHQGRLHDGLRPTWAILGVSAAQPSA